MTEKNDIILIHINDRPCNFARIEQIVSVSKPGWFQVKLMLMQIPVNIVTWVLKKSYINGETFTMKGQDIYFKKIVSSDSKMENKPTKNRRNNVTPLFKD